ncbi:hypothetical protein [Saccharothrix luteola]|uniref:hypothetical protein n=1 Tax=Saccharothrix luteola TaxID=2893018 RepID=UPI001E58C217|nr:hypothetical protein [Saccharothrix luteola]MCC8245113.1 hypothetical protein [Saccharothrix luteola]
MSYSITPALLELSITDVFDYQYPEFVTANGLTGGGGYENWALVTYLLYLRYRHGQFDYQREYPAGAKGGRRVRVDLAFNPNMVTAGTPLILTEWKCNPDRTDLETACTQDVQKFVDILEYYGPRKIYPLPLVFGIGPDGPPLAKGFTTYSFGDGLALYTSGPGTWSPLGLLGYTWYEHQPLPEQAVPDSAPADRAPITDHPSRPRAPLPRRAEEDLAEPV